MWELKNVILFVASNRFILTSLSENRGMAGD